jgi:pimeloyl-ACP methyl ester carboxylesterase
VPSKDAVFRAPRLFVGGSASDYIQPDHHASILRLFPQASIQMIPGAGHWLHAEKPADFLSLVSGFLTGLQ